MAYDAGNRRDIREAEKRAKVTEQQRREIVTGIMSLPAGRQWMCDILVEAHVFATSFADNGLRMAFLEGQRSMGLRLLMDVMGACPDQYVQMMRERNARDTADDSRSRRNRENLDGSSSGQGADDGSRGNYGANVDSAGTVENYGDDPADDLYADR